MTGLPPKAPPPKFHSSCEIAIHVSDLGTAERFYGQVLGFKLISKKPDLLEFETGSLRLFVKLDTAELISYIPSLEVADYKTARKYLEDAGCRTKTVGEGAATYFQDPFGLVFDIVERPARQPL